MKTPAVLVLLSILFPPETFAQDTFSIVAVDTATGEIGSAGASCVGGGVGAFILSDVIEGIGAIHSQASYLSQNQQTAHGRMLLGDSPQQIIDWMTAHDAQGNPSIRQYGVVDLTRHGASAAYTGVNCTDYKNHATGPGYSVQGNILIGQVIIDTMRNTYLRTGGPLADRLMATLQAAKIIGADTRCASRGTSSQSSFIKIVRIGDGNLPYLQRVIGNSAVNVDPIDLLQTQFNLWKDSLRAKVDPFRSQLTVTPETLITNSAGVATIRVSPRNNSDSLFPAGTRSVILRHTGAGLLTQPTSDYVGMLYPPATPGTDTITARVISGTDTVGIFWKRVVWYVNLTTAGILPIPLPRDLILFQNYPNPFNPVTVIRYGLPGQAHVILTVYDVLGRTIRTLVSETMVAGYHQALFDVTGIPSGVYVYRLEAGKRVRTQKMMVLR